MHHTVAMSSTEHNLWTIANILGIVVVLAVAALLSLLIYLVKIIDRRVVAVRDRRHPPPRGARGPRAGPARVGDAPLPPARRGRLHPEGLERGRVATRPDRPATSRHRGPFCRVAPGPYVVDSGYAVDRGYWGA